MTNRSPRFNLTRSLRHRPVASLFLPLAATALILFQTQTHANGEVGDFAQQPFQSTRTRAEVQKEAMQAAHNPQMGEIGDARGMGYATLPAPVPATKSAVTPRPVHKSAHLAYGEAGE